jgi:formate hydrogenlyase subunit 3/multisubunit Na+/H+ antiporter MnhD subunit
MAENEIRLRRKAMSAGKLKNYRNYALLLKRHKRDSMIRQAIRFMIYFLIVALLLTISFIVVYNTRKQEMEKKKMEKVSDFKISDSRLLKAKS